MEFTSLEIEQREAVLIAHINRPDRANALNHVLWNELKQLAQLVDQRPSIRVLVLAANGRHFCAGIDFSLVEELRREFLKRTDGRRQEWLRSRILELQDCFSAFERCSKPVIAAVDGACVGGGIDLITACDIRYATTTSHFCIKEIDLGIVADIGTIQRLPSIVGEGIARELTYTARSIDGAEAHRIGLVNQVFADKAALIQAAMKLAQIIASKSPLAVRNTKRTFNHARDHSVADGLAYVATLNAGILFSADAQESMMATMQGRSPLFDD